MGMRISGKQTYLFYVRQPGSDVALRYENPTINAYIEEMRKSIKNGKIIDGLHLLRRIADMPNLGQKKPEILKKIFIEAARELVDFCHTADYQSIKGLARILETEGQAVAAAMLRLHCPKTEDPRQDQAESLVTESVLINTNDNNLNVLKSLYFGAVLAGGEGLAAKKYWEAIAWAVINACEDKNIKVLREIKGFLLEPDINQPLAAAMIWLY
jgi:hypothetical protein